MNPEALALLTEAEKLARIADEVSRAYAFELSRVLRDLERELHKLALEAMQGRRSSFARAVRAARLRQQIQQALRTAGYERLAETATTRYLDRLVAQLSTLREVRKLLSFTSSDLTRILALKELAKLDLLGQGQEIALAVWRTFAQGLFASRPVGHLMDDLAESLDVELHKARTLYDTTVNVFGRQVEAMKAQPDDVFAYMGPLDVRTRPFCHQRVGKVYTKAEIDAMDNGQIPNVFLTAGGYNCRHAFIAVSKLSELRQLVGTDQRMPEVEARLAQFPAAGRKAA